MQASVQKSLRSVPLLCPCQDPGKTLFLASSVPLLTWYPKTDAHPDGTEGVCQGSAPMLDSQRLDQPPVPWAACGRACIFLPPGLLLLAWAGFFWGAGCCREGSPSAALPSGSLVEN